MYDMYWDISGLLEYTKADNMRPGEFVQPLNFQFKIPYMGKRSYDCGEDALRSVFSFFSFFLFQ